MPDDAKKEMYNVIEKSGNIRLERVAMGFADNAEKRDDMKIFIRFSGKGNRTWALEALKMLDGGRLQAKESKADDGTPITILQDGKRAPITMLVGNSEVMVLGYKNDMHDHEKLMTEVLETRAKKKPNASAGILKTRLAKVPEKAVALCVGDLPKEVARDFGFFFDPAPTNITAFIERLNNGLDVQIETQMANRDDADKLVGKVGGLRKEGIAGLQQAMNQPLPPGTPPIPFQSLINLLESLQVQSDTDKAQIRLVVPDALLQQMGSLGAMTFGVGRAAPLQPPPPAVKKDK
jgi:hypothetical protein